MTRPLRIGVYGARAIPSTYSGYETFLTTLLPQLADRGHEVTMYCRKGEIDGAGPYQGVDRVILPVIQGKQFSTLSHGVIAAVAARRARHDVVLVVNVANAPYCAIARYTGQPVVLNTDGQEWLRGKWGKAARGWFRASARMAGSCATGLVADCAAMARIYEEDFHAPSTVIPYCPPARDVVRTSVLEDLGIEERGYFVVGGRLNPENNIDTIAERYRQAHTALPLLVLGSSNYDSPVEKNLADTAAADPRIRVLGHVGDRHQFFDLLARARGYLHGHSVGGMNPSLVEAMHASANILALDTPFNREVLGEDGRFFDLATVAAAVDREAEASVEDLIERGRRAQKLAGDLYSVEGVVDAYEALLAEAATRRVRKALALPTRWDGRSTR